MNKTLIMTMSVALFGFSGLAMAKPDGDKGRSHKGGDLRKAMMEKYDADKDGKLSDDEKKAAKTAWMEKMKKQLDTDGDGTVSDDEKKAFRSKMSKRGGHKGERGSHKGHKGHGRKGGEEMKKRLLEKFDADKDGKLSDDEKKAAREGMKERHEAMKKKMAEMKKNFMEKHDTDSDGKLSDDEKKAIREGYKAKHEEFKAQMLKKYDNDGDGELSEDERKEARDSEKQDLLDKFDADNSGELEGDERKKAGDWMMENRPFRMHGHSPKGKRGGKDRKGDKKDKRKAPRGEG